MKIIYPINPNDETSPINVISPSATCGLTVNQIAKKDVPKGTPYKIVTNATIPTDRTFRHAWEVVVSDCNDGTGQDYGVGSDNPTPSDWLPEEQGKPLEFAEEYTQENWEAHLAEEAQRIAGYPEDTDD